MKTQAGALFENKPVEREKMQQLKYSTASSPYTHRVNLAKLPTDHLTGEKCTVSQMKKRILKQGFVLAGKRQK